MTTATQTLTDFLLARIAEDEGDAHYLRNVGVGGPQYGTVNEVLDRLSGRMLADCETKRRIVALHPVDKEHGHCCVDPDDVHLGEAMYGGDPCETLSALAAVYADHPDYREEWRV